MLYDPAIPPVGVSPRVTVIHMHQETCEKMFIAHCSEQQKKNKKKTETQMTNDNKLCIFTQQIIQ